MNAIRQFVSLEEFNKEHQSTVCFFEEVLDSRLKKNKSITSQDVKTTLLQILKRYDEEISFLRKVLKKDKFKSHEINAMKEQIIGYTVIQKTGFLILEKIH